MIVRRANMKIEKMETLFFWTSLFMRAIMSHVQYRQFDQV